MMTNIIITMAEIPTIIPMYTPGIPELSSPSFPYKVKFKQHILFT